MKSCSLLSGLRGKGRNGLIEGKWWECDSYVQIDPEYGCMLLPK